MRTLEAIDTIRAARPAVWNGYTDIDRLPERIGILASVERVAGPAFGVGTIWRQRLRFIAVEESTPEGDVVRLFAPHERRDAPIQEQEVVSTIVALEPHQHFVAECRSPIGRSFVGYEFRDARLGVATDVRVRCRYEGVGWVSRATTWLLGRTIARSTQIALRRDLSDMKRSIELDAVAAAAAE